MPEQAAAWPFPLDDPYPAYAEARAHGPVLEDPHAGAPIVLSYALVEEVLRDPRSSVDPRSSPTLAGRLGPAADLFAGNLLTSDPPAHTRLRSAVNRFFTPRSVARIEHRVAAIVDAAVAPLLDGQPIDLIADVARPIPIAVIAELFDIGVEGAEVLAAETPALVEALEPNPTSAQVESLAAAALTVMLQLVPLIAARRAEPGDDLVSALVHADADLGDDEVAQLCLLLLAAGHETTANLIGNGTLALLRHPEQHQRLTEDPSLVPAAVEEMLRYEGPIQAIARIATTDRRLGDVMVPAGRQLLLALGAANRDPERHTHPDAFDVTRSRPTHLAFGHGIHFCVGAGLARLEATHAFRRLTRPGVLGDRDWTAAHAPSITFRRLSRLSLQT
jgi:cytochrome P450